MPSGSRGMPSWIFRKIKPKTCATIRFTDNEAYVDLERLFIEHTQPKGLKIVDRSGIKQADSDFSAVATRIIADSLATSGDLAAHYGVPESRIKLVYPGVDESLAPVTDPAALSAVRTFYAFLHRNDLVTVNPDGTLMCSAAGKPCSEVEFQNAVAELSKAITKGGQQNF